jgi:proteasome accessory factor B
MELRFAPEATARVRQSFWHRSAQLTDRENGGVELRLTVASEVEMRPWVLAWGAQVEVLAPPSLRQHVADSMAAGARVYAGG